MRICLCRFIQYCELEQGYTGFDYKDAEGEEDMVSRLASLKISSDGMQHYVTLSELYYVLVRLIFAFVSRYR